MLKVVCGAGNEDCESVKRLVYIYAKAGCKYFDLSARKEILEAAKEAQKLAGEGEFYCLYVLEGKGTLESPSQTWEIAAGAQFFVPAACGEYCIRAAQGETVRVLKMHGPK